MLEGHVEVGADALLPGDQAQEIVVDVLPDRVRVAVDGRDVIDWRGARERLSLSDYWRTRRDDVLFVGSYDCRYRISRLTLEPLDGGD